MGPQHGGDTRREGTLEKLRQYRTYSGYTHPAEGQLSTVG